MGTVSAVDQVPLLMVPDVRVTALFSASHTYRPSGNIRERQMSMRPTPAIASLPCTVTFTVLAALRTSIEVALSDWTATVGAYRSGKAFVIVRLPP